jgi:hypothetical protein
MKKLLFLLLIFNRAHALEDLSKTKEWHNLLHYKKSFFKEVQSEVDSSQFFLSKEGSQDPLKELRSTIDAFLKTPEIQCQFPARFYFIKQKTSLKFPKAKCLDFDKFKNKLRAKSLSVVFSSHYMDSPSSAFGHTLLRIKKNKHLSKEDFPLLDYAVNFAASNTTNNALAYAFKGMSGDLKGIFSTLPYFYKIREYNDYEARDLWEYELNLKQVEISKIIRHLWEMKKAHFDYYYLSENCSYHLLGLLDIANSNWNLTQRTSKFVIPSDTIKIITQTPGLVSHVKYRPSLYSKIKQKLNNVNEQQLKSVKYINEKLSIPKSLLKTSKKSQAEVLDLAIDFYDYKFASAVLKEDPEVLQQKRILLLARGNVDYVSEISSYKTPKLEAPHTGHGARRMSVGFGKSNKENEFLRFSHRFALHEIADPYIGQMRNATLEMGNLSLKYYLSPQAIPNLVLKKFSLINILSLSPITPHFKTISWGIDMGLENISKKNYCNNCTSYYNKASAGVAYRHKKLLLYFLMNTQLDISSQIISRGYNITLSPELNLNYTPNQRLTLRGGYKYHYYLLSKVKWSNTFKSSLRFKFINDLVFDLSYNSSRQENTLQGDFYYYY